MIIMFNICTHSVPAFSFSANDYTFTEGDVSRVVSVMVVKQDDLQVLSTVTVNVGFEALTAQRKTVTCPYTQYCLNAMCSCPTPYS